MASQYVRAWLYFDPQAREVIVYSADAPDLSGKPLKWVWEQGWRLRTYAQDNRVTLVRPGMEHQEAGE
ncbi:MAG: hypothetical protein H5T60_06400 [Anaerolineae bacterium]|nr:hypothetical protein [Anaerolineae bacterium]